MSLPVRHPDEIAGLAPDCRRLLREEYGTILARMARQPVLGEVEYVDDRGLVCFRPETRPEALRRVARTHGTVGAAVAEYRRVAAMWGVDVSVQS